MSTISELMKGQHRAYMIYRGTGDRQSSYRTVYIDLGLVRVEEGYLPAYAKFQKLLELRWNFSMEYPQHGWLGMRFQLPPSLDNFDVYNHFRLTTAEMRRILGAVAKSRDWDDVEWVRTSHLAPLEFLAALAGSGYERYIEDPRCSGAILWEDVMPSEYYSWREDTGGSTYNFSVQARNEEEAQDVMLKEWGQALRGQRTDRFKAWVQAGMPVCQLDAYYPIPNYVDPVASLLNENNVY